VLQNITKNERQEILERKRIFLEKSFEMAEFARIKARKADKMGNCVFKGTGYNFNAIMASKEQSFHTAFSCFNLKIEAARAVIVEAEEIVEVGETQPEHIHLPGLYVNRLFKGEKFEHRIEILKTFEQDSSNKNLEDIKKSENPRERIANIATQEFKNGINANLGVGIPNMGIRIFLQSENGMTGCGPCPVKDEEDSDWINAGKETVTPLPGVSRFGSDESFGRIRGGHLDMTVLRASDSSRLKADVLILIHRHWSAVNMGI
jgi:3-oxoacid CoA-transferase